MIALSSQPVQFHSGSVLKSKGRYNSLFMRMILSATNPQDLTLRLSYSHSKGPPLPLFAEIIFAIAVKHLITVQATAQVRLVLQARDAKTQMMMSRPHCAAIAPVKRARLLKPARRTALLKTMTIQMPAPQIQTAATDRPVRAGVAFPLNAPTIRNAPDAGDVRIIRAAHADMARLVYVTAELHFVNFPKTQVNPGQHNPLHKTNL